MMRGEKMIKSFAPKNIKEFVMEAKELSTILLALLGAIVAGVTLVDEYIKNDIWILNYLYVVSICFTGVLTAMSCYLLCKVIHYKRTLIDIFDGDIPLVGILTLTSYICSGDYQRNNIKVKDVCVDINIQDGKNVYYTTKFRIAKRCQISKFKYTILSKEKNVKKEPTILLVNNKEIKTIEPILSEKAYREKLITYTYSFDGIELEENCEMSIAYTLEDMFNWKKLQYFVIDPANFSSLSINDIDLSINSNDKGFNNHNIFLMEYNRIPFSPCKEGKYSKSGKQITSVQKGDTYNFEEKVKLSKNHNTFLIARIQ